MSAREIGGLSPWRFLSVALGVALVGTGVAVVFGPERPAPVDAGVIVGFRFSGDFPHRCRLWIRPDGAPGDTRVLVDPNAESECLTARTFDRWRRLH